MLLDRSEDVQGRAGGRQDRVQAPGHPLQQHAGTEPLQVQPDQINMAVLLRYLVKSDASI